MKSTPKGPLNPTPSPEAAYDLILAYPHRAPPRERERRTAAPRQAPLSAIRPRVRDELASPKSPRGS